MIPVGSFSVKDYRIRYKLGIDAARSQLKTLIKDGKLAVTKVLIDGSYFNYYTPVKLDQESNGVHSRVR